MGHRRSIAAGWLGVFLLAAGPAHAEIAKLIPGRIIDGSTKSGLTYCARAPEGFRPAAAATAKKWPAIVILHGSNMNAKAYVNTIAATWPDVARDYLLLGINGEQQVAGAAGPGKEPAYNYTYVNYVGRSTFKGFPGSDRESPALVAEAMAELRDAYPVAKYFVGGHSQGAFLTYSLLMNFPEQIAGAFPVSGGLIFQCEPTAYADETLRAAQRAVPLAIVHGKNDPAVDFAMAQYAATAFGESNWPALRLLADDAGAGHMFGRLPVATAVRWLEAQSSEDPAKLVDFAEKFLKANAVRDAIATSNRARGLKPTPAITQRLDRLQKQLDAKAAPGAKTHLANIRNPAAGKPWIDAFLAYRDEYQFAPAAREAMEAFAALRAEHEPPANKLMNEARAAFQQNRRDEGYAKYQEVVDKHFAASSYRNAKRWLAERK
jgi:predicted esterase